MCVKMYLSWRTKQRKFSPLGAKHHFLLLFCPPVLLHLHKREMGLFTHNLCLYIYLVLYLKARLAQLKNQQISWLFNAFIFENFEFKTGITQCVCLNFKFNHMSETVNRAKPFQFALS